MRITKKRTVVTTGLVLTLATFVSKPSQAATLAISDATVNIYNFSYTSPDIIPSADAQTFTFTSAIDGTVTANADANASASFERDSENGAFNFSRSITTGTGSNYFGIAQSLAKIGIADFKIAKNTTLSFDFDVMLNLATSIDSPSNESANAYGKINFDFLNQSDGSVLDYFYVAGNLSTPDDNDLLIYDNTASITFDNGASSLNTLFGGTQENAFALIKGTYSRTFTEDTVLSIRESKFNSASVQVPEPLSCGGIALAGIMGWYMKRQQKRQQG